MRKVCRNVHTGEILTTAMLRSLYDEEIDETYGDVTVGETTYPTSKVMREMDYYGYTDRYLKWQEREEENGAIEWVEQ